MRRFTIQMASRGTRIGHPESYMAFLGLPHVLCFDGTSILNLAWKNTTLLQVYLVTHPQLGSGTCL